MSWTTVALLDDQGHFLKNIAAGDAFHDVSVAPSLVNGVTLLDPAVSSFVLGISAPLLGCRLVSKWKTGRIPEYNLPHWGSKAQPVTEFPVKASNSPCCLISALGAATVGNAMIMGSSKQL
jgi:hypothetical protein